MSKPLPTQIAKRGTPPTPRTPRSAVYIAAVCALLALATLGVFWPATGFEFINCDDPEYFASNPRVQAGLSWEQIKWAFTTGYFGNWLPLTWLSLMLDSQIGGIGPRGPHLTNVLLHAANT